DYYGHSGAWFDVQESPWLSHVGAPQYELGVVFLGRGQGSVASDLPGISCPGVCSIAWEQGARVALHATPAAGFRFLHWGGACSSSADCALAMDGPKTVTATFAPLIVSLAVSVRGRGTVKSSPRGIACPGRCAAPFASGGTVRLRAKPARGWQFVGWVGACKGRG